MERDPLIAQESEIQTHRHESAVVDGDGGKSVLSSKANSISGDENSPLLGAGERDGGADIDDFEGLPWHRKPSVRYPLCAVSCAENWRLRFQIFWLLPPFCLFTIAFGGYDDINFDRAELRTDRMKCRRTTIEHHPSSYMQGIFRRETISAWGHDAGYAYSHRRPKWAMSKSGGSCSIFYVESKMPNVARYR